MEKRHLQQTVESRQPREHTATGISMKAWMQIVGALLLILGGYWLLCIVYPVVSRFSAFLGVVVGVVFVGLAVGVLGMTAVGVLALYVKHIEIPRRQTSLLHPTDNNMLPAVYDWREKQIRQGVNGELPLHVQNVRQARRVEVQELPTVDMPKQLAPPQADNAPMLSFSELLHVGLVQSAMRQGKMLLGYVDGQLRYGSWLDLYSCGIGGVSGGGKTTTVRFLLFQAILAEGKFVMIDPHIGEPEESLAAQFKTFKNIHALPPCDDDPTQVAKRVRYLFKEYTRRKARGIKGPALIFVLDEFNEIIRRLPDELRRELADLLLTIAQGGRKFGIFAMVIGQRWSENDLGGKNVGAAIRSSLASVLAHRFTDEDQAKKLIGSKSGAKCLDLEQGHYYFRDTQGKLTAMVTPYTEESDGLSIQQILDGENTPDFSENTEEFDVSELPLEPLSFRDFKHENTNSETSENTEIHTLARKVMSLQAEGKGKGDIMRLVWNVNPGASDEYKQAVQQYQAVMHYIAARLEA